MVGNISIDFTIDSAGLNPQLIRVIDNSEWFFAEDKQSTIFIYPPGSSRAITHIFAKNKVNTYNSVNLQLSCLTECGEQTYSDLNDGVWKVCVKSAYEGLEKTRYYLKTDRYQVELAKEWINTGLDYTDTKDARYDALSDSKKHLTTAEAYMLDGDFTKANREFQEAQKKFNNIRKCKNCF